MIAATIATPEQVMTEATSGRFSKHALIGLLAPAARPAFAAACAKIEIGYTEKCRSSNDPCLESGCSCVGDVCLQPLLLAGTEYHRRCGAEWAKLFAEHGNRDASWKLTLAAYDVR